MDSSSSSGSLKRSSFAAQLEQDPSLSTSRRKEKSQSFSSKMVTASLERKLLVAQEAQRTLENQLRERDMQIERLKSDRRFLAERETEERAEKESERQARDEEKRQSDGLLRSIRNQLMRLQAEHDDIKDTHSSLQCSTSLTISNQKTQCQTLQHQISLLQSELSTFREQAQASENTVRDLRGQLEEMSISSSGPINGESTAAAEDGKPKDWEIVREELKRQATYLRTLETTNAKLTGEVAVLRQRSGNAEVLKEEKRTLEKRLEGVDKLRLRCAELEREIEIGKKEREAMNAAMSTGSTSTSKLTRELTDLRFEHARLLESLGDVTGQLKFKEGQVAELQKGLESIHANMEITKKSVADLEVRAIRAERKLEIERRGSGFLKAMVSSFEAERSVNINEDSQPAGDASMADERLAALQVSLDDFRELNAQLEAQLQEAKTKGHPELLAVQQKVREEAEATIASLRKAESSHLDKIEELEQALFELRGDIASGAHVPPGVRILQFKDNPATQWEASRKEILDGLRKENVALIEKLVALDGKALESPMKDEPRTAEGVPRESWDRLEREKEALAEVVQQRDKRLLRLQQVFTAKSQEFREAISSILGFKLAFYPNGQVRVTSQYDLGASFVFQPSAVNNSSDTSTPPETKMQLIGQGEGGPEDLPQLVRYWVEGEMCIPGLMASVTLECYEKAKTRK